MAAMTVVFWTIVALIAYTYVGYPLLVAVAGWVMRRDVAKACTFPSLSVVIAAFDEEDEIEARIRNVLDSLYPHGKLEVVIASDGSTDGTVARARLAGQTRVRVLDLPRRGKAAALAAGARSARGDVLVFTDANTKFRADTLYRLALNFGDPQVGGVAGNTEYRVGADAESTGRGEDLYWRYDTWLKRQESRTGSVVSAHGGIYAVRRELFRPVEDAGVTDDFAISTAVVEQGRRLVFDPDVIAWERPMSKGSVEFRRRIRLMTRGVRSVLLRRRLLDPIHYGFYSVALFSRKVLRRLLPLTFPVLFVASVVIASRSPFFAAVAAAQVALLTLAVIGWTLRGEPAGRSIVFYAPLYFCLANLASIAALWNVARGVRIERWSPQRHVADPAHGRPQTASGR
jgi:cellulose synthase/poly-beta-1,6-N-acetylglucosamine synthase-like glycosyltransferase